MHSTGNSVLLALAKGAGVNVGDGLLLDIAQLLDLGNIDVKPLGHQTSPRQACSFMNCPPSFF